MHHLYILKATNAVEQIMLTVMIVLTLSVSWATAVQWADGAIVATAEVTSVERDTTDYGTLIYVVDAEAPTGRVEDTMRERPGSHVAVRADGSLAPAGSGRPIGTPVAMLALSLGCVGLIGFVYVSAAEDVRSRLAKAAADKVAC